MVGVGHPFRGDDRVGSYVLKTILEQMDSTLPEGIYLFDAEEDVEVVITKLADLAPENVIFIDACEMRMKPGDTQFLPIAETSYPFFTTHGIPLKLLAEQLLPRSGVWVLAIQPKQIDFGEDLTPEVLDAAVSISRFLTRTLEEELPIVP